MAKYNGKDLKVWWIYSGGTVDLTGDSREFTWNKEINEIDAVTRGSTAMEVLPDLPTIGASLNSLDTAGTAQAWENLDTSQEGTIRWAPNGTATPNRKYEMPAIVQSVEVEYPHNDVVTVSIGWRGQSTISKSNY